MEVISAIAWLADAPLFIDEDQVSRFYDAILQPDNREGGTTISLDEESVKKLAGKIGVKGEVSPGGLSKILSHLFNLKLKAEASGEVGKTKKTSESYTVELFPIETPQRQLVQLALHYLANYGDRLVIVEDLATAEWRTPENILRPPRALTFIDVPPNSQILPLAAEFADGNIIPIFKEFKGKDGGGQPAYPDGGSVEDRCEYWKWFRENVSPTAAIAALESASKEGGRIQWIDYRIPIDDACNTLHLHISPAGQYDTGTFAYNFVRRGFHHGVRLIGTLKSEPDMNVLAIYEK